MDLRTLDQEEIILSSIEAEEAVSLERVWLVLSGLKTDDEIHTYQNKIGIIFERFLNKCEVKGFSGQSRPPLYLQCTIAKSLSEYLWNSKPKRFGESFLLADVIDAQLDPDVNRLVGTCVGLTALYSVLGVRAGLDLSVLAASDHLLSRLRVGEEIIDIDHTDPQGFDCRNRKSSREFPLWTLAANMLNSRGLRNERSGNFLAAKEDYEKAILINPEYANAYNNRGNMRFRDEDFDGAIADYSEAIRLDPCLCEAYCNRGMAQQRLGRYPEAREDYRAAMSTNAEYSDARECLRVLEDVERNKLPASECDDVI